MITRAWLVGLLVALLALIPLGPASVHAASTVMVSTCDESHLRNAITSAGAGGTVTFSCSGIITLASTIAISQDLTIDGTGQTVTISGGASVGVFVVNTSVTVTLKDLTIAHGSASGGGGIVNQGTLTVTNSTFSANSATTGYGGGIFNVSGGTLTVTNSTFSGNSAVSGGGGISNQGTLSVANSTFSGNNAFSFSFTGDGGGVFNNGMLTVTNSTFSGNSAGGDGGGIFNQGTLIVTNSTFSGNRAASYGGGGIFNQGTLTVTNSTFSSNSVGRVGGGISNASGSSLTVTNSTFSGNSASGAGSFGGRGGAIANAGALSVTTSTFSGNSASGFFDGGVGSFFDGGGGGILNDGGTLSVTNSTFSGNSVSEADGGGILNNGTLIVTNSTFSDNSTTIAAANGGGGGIFSFGILTVTNSTFSGNSAPSGFGGGIFNNGDTLSVTNSTFSGNSATIAAANGGGGGGIFSYGPANLVNTILASSTGGNCAGGPGPITDQGGNLADDGTCPVAALSSSKNNATPLNLGSLGNNGGPTQTIALLSGSVAIDFTSCPQSTDQRGFPRPDNGELKCDSGAYEFQDPAVAPSDTDLGLANVPANITANATSSAGAVVSYTAPSAVDEAGDSPVPSVSCTGPASGSTFPIGTTTVTCTATSGDDTPSTVSASFTVTVNGAVAQINGLIVVVNSNSFSIASGLKSSLDTQLQAVLADLQANNTNQACNDLTAFVNHVQAQSGKKLTTAQANQLLAAASNIMKVLGC